MQALGWGWLHSVMDWDSEVVEPWAGPLFSLPVGELQCFGWRTGGDLQLHLAEQLFLWDKKEETAEEEATVADVVW